MLLISTHQVVGCLQMHVRAAQAMMLKPDSIKKLLTYDYLDPDASEFCYLSAAGMHLVNTRHSGFNVKKFIHGYIDKYANDGINILFTR
jgi:hypothetical protein